MIKKKAALCVIENRLVYANPTQRGEEKGTIDGWA